MLEDYKLGYMQDVSIEKKAPNSVIVTDIDTGEVEHTLSFTTRQNQLFRPSSFLGDDEHLLNTFNQNMLKLNDQAE
jgi:hypothetical protein